jgi:hypothetical protein
VVHHAVQAVVERLRRTPPALVALICCAALLAGCGGSSASKPRVNLPPPGVGASIRTDNCTDWKRGTLDQRHGTVVQLRQFAGGAVGSSAGIQNGPVLDDDRAYNLLQSYCANAFARGFKLYKLYERAAAFLGH